MPFQTRRLDAICDFVAVKTRYSDNSCQAAYDSADGARRTIVAPRWAPGSSQNSTTLAWRSTRRLDDPTLHAAAAAVHETHFAKAGNGGRGEVFADDRRDVFRRKCVEIELAFDWNPVLIVSHGPRATGRLFHYFLAIVRSGETSKLSTTHTSDRDM